MKAATAVRMVIMVGATGFVLWRLTPVLDKLDAMSDGLDMAAMLSERASPPEASAPADELVVYSPKGEQLTEDERRRLLAAAARMRPRVPETTRVSLPGHHPAEIVAESAQGAPTADTVDVEELVTPELMQSLIEQLDGIK